MSDWTGAIPGDEHLRSRIRTHLERAADRAEPIDRLADAAKAFSQLVSARQTDQRPDIARRNVLRATTGLADQASVRQLLDVDPPIQRALRDNGRPTDEAHQRAKRCFDRHQRAPSVERARSTYNEFADALAKLLWVVRSNVVYGDKWPSGPQLTFPTPRDQWIATLAADVLVYCVEQHLDAV